MAAQRHHILHEKWAWESYPDHKRLRGVKELIPLIGAIAHRGVHRSIEQVPLPDRHMIKRINANFYPAKNDTIQSMRNLEEAIELAMDNPYSSYTALALGRIMIDAISLQIPYIEQGFHELNG